MKRAPKTFDQFRKLITGAALKAGAPKDFCAEAADTGFEGAGVAEALFRSWETVQDDWKLDARDRHPALKKQNASDRFSMLLDRSDDIIQDALGAYANPYNYPPGRRVEVMEGSLKDFLGRFFKALLK